jgi:hypothetical protein
MLYIRFTNIKNGSLLFIDYLVIVYNVSEDSSPLMFSRLAGSLVIRGARNVIFSPAQLKMI